MMTDDIQAVAHSGYVMVRAATLLLVIGIVPGRTLVPAQEPSRAGEQLFTGRILPLLKDKCLACHGDEPNKLRGGLDLRSRSAMLQGGDSGQPALAPGHPEKSLIYLAATRSNP